MNFSELSKEVSYALRHAPWEYELELDENGGVPLEQLLSSLQLNSKWENLTVIDLIEMIEKSEKKRHVIYDGKIRAFYGHSIPMKIVKEEKTPPEFLYHGTARRFLNSIKEKGLLPQSRQYVHLSQDIETAETVGKRHDNKAGILIIDSLKAWNDGIKFYYGNEKVWLADMVPYKYVLVK
ncbi:RNA 2'-phosphotransferase [Lacrimispora xylanisolvens]|jgi:putative RNA 2'-phosphotransferase|uniref:RNA 2'-phosphotransferase n=1 Tax=Lacrimispora xylanisolvens TaxID=384636 RepID=UPI0024027C79